MAVLFFVAHNEQQAASTRMPWVKISFLDRLRAPPWRQDCRTDAGEKDDNNKRGKKKNLIVAFAYEKLFMSQMSED